MFVSFPKCKEKQQAQFLQLKGKRFCCVILKINIGYNNQIGSFQGARNFGWVRFKNGISNPCICMIRLYGWSEVENQHSKTNTRFPDAVDVN